MYKSAFYSYAENLSDPAFLKKVIDIIQPREGDTLLDLGTGKGYTSIAIAPLVNSIIAIDQDDTVINRFKTELDNIERSSILIEGKEERNIIHSIIVQLYPDISSTTLISLPNKIQIKKLPVEKLNEFDSDSFDIVTCRAALHHFANPIGVLKEVNRILKPGGKFEVMDAIFSENGRDIWSAITRMKELDYKSYYTYQELISFLNESGFIIENIFPYKFKRNFNTWAGSAKDEIKSRLFEAMIKIPETLKKEVNLILDSNNNLFWEYNCFEMLSIKK